MTIQERLAHLKFPSVIILYARGRDDIAATQMVSKVLSQTDVGELLKMWPDGYRDEDIDVTAVYKGNILTF